MKASPLKLPPSLYSADQLLIAGEELHHYGVGLAQVRRHDPKDAVSLNGLSTLAVEALELLPAEQRQQDEAVETLRQQLERLAISAPQITLVLVARAPNKLKEELVAWLRENIHPGLLVNFHANPDIAGGVLIRSTNHIYDCSFRQALLADSARFTKVLEHV